ncbi:MAG: HNH endonuclease [Drouetiella hepatica Uher 2000/2452]|jgi:putative restriction endonuclease|uniref:HNH endonuclease n=1 Tax=Drouetiella hepatica Uher 2000/2452 TaxID=904376 RepID=A0A951UMZ3_9CYAN|nr:HNH endonuclease [Drouetiella hepatica Uher 2000/2452]
MTKDLSFYVKKFSKLRVDRAHGSVAPHKPILLLSVIELLQQGEIQQNQIFLSAELISTFLKYWTHLGSDIHRSDIALPFYHLTGDGFWHLSPNPGFESTIAAKVKLKSLTALRNAVNYAFLDDDLFNLLYDSESRSYLITAIVQEWFSEWEREFQTLYQVDAFQEFQLRLFEKGGETYSVEDLADEAKTVVRDAAFRKIVVSLYGQRCAFCRLRIISLDSQNIVDGAHIKPFSEFRDDRFDNGLALCKNHHWAFDRGWFGINEDYRIIIPHDRFTEESPQDTRSMKDFDGELINLPTQATHYPRLESLDWHRQRWNIA